MRVVLRTLLVLAVLASIPSVAADQPQVRFLKFPAADVAFLGQIHKLYVTVSCASIATLNNVPELYNIRMGYDLPTHHVFEATSRLGAAAVDLSRWSEVIGISVPGDTDSKSCFTVKVIAQGFNGYRREWYGPQLGVSPNDA